MNWADYTVLAVIAAFALVGLIKGFVFSIFKIAAFFIAIYASIKLYPIAAGYMAGTALYDSIKKAVMGNLAGKYQSSAQVQGQADGGSAQNLIDGLSIPAYFRQGIEKKLPKPGELIDIQGLLNTIGDEITKVIINILCLILLFLIIRMGLFIIGLILKGIVKLPVLKQFDRLGGFAFGAAEGLLTVYIIFAVLLLVSSGSQFQKLFETVDASILAKGFYHNNILVNWMFPRP